MVLGLTFRRYRPEDFPEYAAVFQAVYGKTIDEAFFQWKNLQNPVLAGEALIYLALDAGRIIGANSFFPSILVHQDQTYRVVQSGDTMVLASHRGQGVFQKILKYAAADLKAEGYAAIYGYANGNSYPGFLKFGFSDLGRINIYYRVVNWQEFLVERASLLGAAGWVLDRGLQTFSRLALRGRKGYTVSLLDFRYDAIPEDLESFIAETQYRETQDTETQYGKGQSADSLRTDSGSNIRLLKDMEYLAWKYWDKPAADYQMLAIRKDGELAGLLILRLDRHGTGIAGEIVERFLRDSGEFRTILGAALEFLRKGGFAFVKIWDPNEEMLRRVLKHALFFERKVELYFIVKLLEDNLSFLTERNSWLINGGDADTA